MADALQPFIAPSGSSVPVAVRDVLAFASFSGARIVAGAAGANARITCVNVMQIPTAEFARADELVLSTTTAFEDASEDRGSLIDALVRREVAALAAHRHALERLGPEALATAEAQRLPVIELPEHARLNVVLREVLEHLVAEQTTQLEEDRKVRDQLADFALAGSGVEDLPLAIGELTGGAVAIVDAHGVVLAASDGPSAATARRVAHDWLADGWNAPAERGTWVVWPVRGAGRRLGCVVAELPDGPAPMHRAVFEHGATNAALAILQIQAAAVERARLREQLVHDLLGGSFEPDAARERAALLGWSPDEPYRVLLAGEDEQGPGRLVALAREHEEGMLAVEHAGACLAIVGAGAHGEQSTDEDTIAIASALAAAGPHVHVGISSVYVGLGGLADATREAAEMLATVGSFPSPRVRRFDPMDPLRILALVPHADLAAFSDHVLRPLDELDADRRDALMATLELLIETDLNVAATARRGDWHYNTVRYRIKRLTELVGPFAEDGERFQSLALALLIRRELKRAAG